MSLFGTIICAKIAEYNEAPSPDPDISLKISFGLLGQIIFEKRGAELSDCFKFSKAVICSGVGVKCLSFELVNGVKIGTCCNVVKDNCDLMEFSNPKNDLQPFGLLNIGVLSNFFVRMGSTIQKLFCM